MRGEKIEGKEGTKGGSSEAEAATDIAMTISVVEEANASSVGNNRAYSDGGGRKDKCGGSQRCRTGTGCGGSPKKGPLCNGSR